MGIERRYKDEDEVFCYGVNWSEYLAGDTITSSEWIVPAGITQVGTGIVGNLCNITISGGVENITYRITNRITTSIGETVDQSIDIKIAEK